MRILLTNDDGILAPGIAAMQRALRSLGEVSVVAPASPQSAVAHAITIPGPIAVRSVHVGEGLTGYAVDGRPVDCVKIAVSGLLPQKPDLVVSGINDGANVAINVLYSARWPRRPKVRCSAYRRSPCRWIAARDRISTERPRSRGSTSTAFWLQNGLRGQSRMRAGCAAKRFVINLNIPALRPGVPRSRAIVRQARR